MRHTEHQHERDETWPFAEDPNTAVVVAERVFENPDQLCGIAHDVDGEWEFLDLSDSRAPDQAIVGCLACMAEQHPVVLEFAHLELGAQAWKQNDGVWEVLPPSRLTQFRTRHARD